MESREHWTQITIADVNVGDVIWLPAGEPTHEDPRKGVTGSVIGREDGDAFAYGRGKRKVQTVWVSLLIRQQDNTIVRFWRLIGALECWRRDEQELTDEPTTEATE